MTAPEQASGQVPGQNGVAKSRGTAQPPSGLVDPRQPRFAATITAIILLVGTYLVLIGPSLRPRFTTSGFVERVLDPGFLVLLLAALLFAWSLISARTQPLAALYRAVLRPRLGPPREWEDARPPRFAQGVGLFVVGAGLVLQLLGVPWALAVAGAAAFIAAFLNAAFGFCLGCEIYLLLQRVRALKGAST